MRNPDADCIAMKACTLATGARKHYRHVASMLGIMADREHPIVEGELILERIRFEGLLPPVVLGRTIAMRKPSKVQFHTRSLPAGQHHNRRAGRLAALGNWPAAKHHHRRRDRLRQNHLRRCHHQSKRSRCPIPMTAT